MGKKKNNNKVSSNKIKSSTTLSYKCEILQAKNINAHVIIYRNFLTEDEINTLKNLGPTGIKMGHDRDNDLSFEHEVWRFENELEKNAKELYDKVLNVMFLTDEQIFELSIMHTWISRIQIWSPWPLVPKLIFMAF